MSPLAPGTELAGRYRLGRQVGDDGLMETWTATDQVLARVVEVEVLPNGAADVREAFLAATAATARLTHPGIVSTYDTGESADGLLFVVTERAVGPTLAELIDRHGPLSPVRAVHIGRQVAHALDAAHRRHAVHGAVSPAVVQVADDDRAKLGGFTAGHMRARLAGVTIKARDDVNACARTLIAALLGTYGAPEHGDFGEADVGAGDAVVSARAVRPGIAPDLDALLVDAQQGGPITTAAQLAERLDRLDLVDDAQPNLDGQRTPPLGTKVTTPPVRLTGNRTGAVAGVIVGLLLAAAVAVAAIVLFGRGGTNGPSTPGQVGSTTTLPGPHGGELAVVAAHSFDPFGDQTEQEPRVNNLRDGNPATLWTTEEYKTAHFGGLKPGVGAILLLDATHSLTRLTVTSPSRDWVFSVYVAPQAGTTLAAWGQPVASDVTVSGDITPVRLGGASGKAVLVWITDLGPRLAHPPDPATPYQVSIGEVQVR
jgi:hypothetical protein